MRDRLELRRAVQRPRLQADHSPLSRLSHRFAAKLEKDASGNLEQQVTLALTAVTQHAPTPEQVIRGVTFIHNLERQDHLAPYDALTALCLLSMNLNEFVYLD